MNTEITPLLRALACCIVATVSGTAALAQAIIVDHTCIRLDQVPASAIQTARERLHIAYGHTSHGSQLVTGMQDLVAFMNAKTSDAFPNNAFTFNNGGSGGALDLRDTPFSGAQDLGAPNRTAWATATRTYLAAHPEVNVIIWSWCGQVDGTEAEINTYLTLMSGLERDYPGVRFVYMTGHLNGGGATGNVTLRNNQIREYCRANNKVLYDFADIESYDPDGLVNYMERRANDNCDYDSDGNGSLDRNWATVWQGSHTQNVDWYACSAAHSQSLNGNLKAYAAWWLWARLAGWAGPGGGADTTAPSVPTRLRAASTQCTRVDLAWDASSDSESGVSGYRVSRGGVQIGQTSQLSYTDATVSPANGYTYTVVAINGAGLVSVASAALAVTTPADVAAPSVPAGLAVSPATSRSLALAWTASTDNVGVVQYRIRRDGVPVATTTGTAWTDGGLIAGRTYRYTVSARDQAGNESAASAAVERAPVPDAVVPGVSAPATLSASGWFTDLAVLTPAPELTAYDVNLPAWSDYAWVRRWVRRASPDARFGFAVDGAWSLPAGTLWLQQFEIETVCGNPDTRIRIETRVLVRTADGVLGLSYRWNAAQDDAELVAAEGATLEIAVCEGATNTLRTWTMPSRAACLGCHQAAGGLALGFNTRQLNRLGADGLSSANQISAFAAAGWFDGAPPASERLPVHPRVADTNVALETRARAWLDVNCASCHRPGGSAARGFDLRSTTPLGDAGLVGGAVNDTLGDARMRVITPDWPEHSAVAVRVHAVGARQMPVAGRSSVDPIGSRLVSEWIHRLAQPIDAREARLDNLSTRGVIQGGDSVMIGGFVLAGTGSRQVLLRGVGPELARLHVAGVLSNPEIELFRGNTSLARNDNWGASADAAAIRAAAASCGAFALSDGGADAALLVRLDPGSYTVHVRGGAGANAVGMFEAYDVSGDGDSRFVNLSTRLRLGRGDRVAIPGLVVGGDTRRTFLIRAVGPGLALFDLPERLENPRLTLISDGAVVAANDDWWTSEGSAIALAAREVGAFPLGAGSRDACLLITLDPGVYTVVTESDTATEGLVLVETYEVL